MNWKNVCNIVLKKLRWKKEFCKLKLNVSIQWIPLIDPYTMKMNKCLRPKKIL